MRRRAARWALLVARLVARLVALAFVPATLRAQRDTPDTHLQAGVELATLHTQRRLGPEGISFGGFVAVERRITPRVSARAALGLAESVVTTDIQPTCPPDVLCSTRSFPLRVGTFEVHGLYAPWHMLPFALIGGGGLALPIGIRRQPIVTDHLEHDRALKGIARVGAHVALGRSARAPRLQVSRAWLSGAFEALERSDALAFVLVF